MALRPDAVVIGGGAGGLWVIDELRRRGRSAVLLERAALGTGQTVGSQGIIHGGLKYTLSGTLSRSARAIREMPHLWRRCLAGVEQPDLSGVRLRSPCCYLWRTESVRSRAGMVGARAGLRVAPEPVDPADRPAVLAACPGQVLRLDEQVIDAVGFVEQMARRNADVLLRVAPEGGVAFDPAAGPGFGRVSATDAAGRTIELEPRVVVLAAGAGNEALRRELGLAEGAMQRRPLHMTLVRGDLPPLNGHCVDGGRTRVTITSDLDSAGRTVWQVGGQVSEDGVGMDPAALIAHVRAELAAVLPGWTGEGTAWATYCVDRAEGRTPSGRRPEGVVSHRDGAVITAWPTKLALAPLLAARVADAVDKLCGASVSSTTAREFEEALGALDPQRPAVAPPPWETIERWNTAD